MTISIDTSALLSYYQARSGQLSASGSAASGAVSAKDAQPTAPWATDSKAPRASALVTSVLAGRKFVDANAAQLDVKGASQDYRKLFALYQGLNALEGLAERAATKGVTAYETSRLQASFARGMSEVATYLDSLKLDNLRLTRGEAAQKLDAEVGVKRTDPTYFTAPLHTGGQNDEVAAFQGEVTFNLSIKVGTRTHDIAADLSEMGSTPRTMANVVIYLNDKLKAEGVTTRFAVERIPAEPKTITSGGKAITLPAGQDSFALKIKGDATETLTFSADKTAGAVYVAQVAGKDTTANQLLKFQTDVSTSAEPADPAYGGVGQTYTVDGRVFAKTMGPEVQAVRQTVSGPDGSVYVLADVNGTTDGQTIKGATDVALMKYDSAGNLVFSRTLGASDNASGLALAVADDGRVAVAGSVTGGLIPGATLDDVKVSDSFVTLYDADGQEVWTQRRGAKGEDEATAVAFGADGTVYVAGRTKTAMLGQTQQGGWDAYVQGFSTNAKGEGISLFTRQFGTAGDDSVTGIAVNGDQVVLAGVEDGHAVLHSFDVSRTTAAVSAGLTTTAASLSAGISRDLGDLKGGAIAGVAFDGGDLVVAGSTHNGALNSGTITGAHGGGLDAFAARISGDLTAQASDRLTYFGGAGDNAATALRVEDGQVWIAGTATGELGDLAPVGTRDGFIARLDIDAGEAAWARRFTASEGQAAPTTIAVDTDGASVLDRLGLPTGTIDYTDSQRITAATSVRAGDTFYVKTSEGGRGTLVTIEEGDTLKSLAAKITKAAGYRATVSVVKDGAYDKLEIKSLNEKYPLEITAGKGGKDALLSLGLSEGVARTLKGGADEKGLEKLYGLGLPSDLDLSDPASIKRATDALMASMKVIRDAYRDLDPATQAAANAKTATGPAPAYLTAQIANYQAALSRLTGGA